MKGLIAAILLAWALPSWAQLDGNLAIEVWPSAGRFSNQKMVLPGCEVHLVPNTNGDQELSYPCGKLFIPPLGNYLYWVEGESRISPDHLVLVFAGGPYQGRRMAPVRDTVPAGRVVFTGVAENPSLVLRLLHLESHLVDDRMFFEFHRRLPAARALEGALLPGGKAVSFLYDNAKKEYLALSRPFEVQASKTSRVAAPTPPRATAVLAVLERPALLDLRSEDDLSPALMVDEKSLAPDLRFGDGARVYAVWYEVPGKTAQLVLDSAKWQIPETTFALRAGKVETLRPELRPLPQLKVGLLRPPEWNDLEVQILLLAEGASKNAPLAIVPLPPGENEAVFAAIPPRRLEIELRVQSYSLRQEVDASDRLDHRAFFQPEPIVLHGQVFVGEKPSPARVTFYLNKNQRLPESKDDQLVVETDPEGRYQATLYEPGYVPINVALKGREGLPFLISPRFYIEASRELDFHLPGNRFEVQVVDRKSGKGIADAMVGVECYFGENESFVTSARDHTRQGGYLELPPIRSGRLELRVRAAGYEEKEESIKVADGEKGRKVRLELQPLQEGEAVQLLLADGQVASFAQAALFPNTTDSSAPWWQGSASVDGQLELPPERQGSFLLLRHPNAGALVLETGTGEGKSLTLPPRAKDILFEIRERGGNPAPTTAISFRFGQIDVAGRALSWLLGAPLPASDRAGYFRAAGLPAQRLAIIAWAPQLQADALTGNLDAFATELDPREVKSTIALTRVE